MYDCSFGSVDLESWDRNEGRTEKWNRKGSLNKDVLSSWLIAAGCSIRMDNLRSFTIYSSRLCSWGENGEACIHWLLTTLSGACPKGHELLLTLVEQAGSHRHPILREDPRPRGFQIMSKRSPVHHPTLWLDVFLHAFKISLRISSVIRFSSSYWALFGNFKNRPFLRSSNTLALLLSLFCFFFTWLLECCLIYCCCFSFYRNQIGLNY